MKATLKLRLHTCHDAEGILLETLRQSTACFNAVTERGWASAERNATRLHHATYKGLREAYPALPSQLHCAARVKATEALKSVDERLKQGRQAGRPTSELCPVRYDARSSWVKLSEGMASLATIAGRVCVRFNICGYYRRYLTWKPCSAELLPKMWLRCERRQKCRRKYRSAGRKFKRPIVSDTRLPSAVAIGLGTSRFL